MLNNLVNIGFGNFVNSTRVLIILSPDSAPVKRLKEEARAEKRLVDATYGRRTRAVIITDSNHVILSSIQPETIAHRFTEYSGQNFKLKENTPK
ncbi:Extracellular matrix regulatory protein A [subsurface metagenome]